MKNLFTFMIVLCAFNVYSQTYQIKSNDNFESRRLVYLKKISTDKYYFYLSSQGKYIDDYFEVLTVKNNKAILKTPSAIFNVTKTAKSVKIDVSTKDNLISRFSAEYPQISATVPKTFKDNNYIKRAFTVGSVKQFKQTVIAHN